MCVWALGQSVCVFVCVFVCALIESQRVIGIEVTGVNKERKALKAEKCTQGGLWGSVFNILTKLPRKNKEVNRG